jgi:hypothetical protein
MPSPFHPPWWSTAGSRGPRALASKGEVAPTPTLGRGFLWYDEGTKQFMVSEDGGAAVAISAAVNVAIQKTAGETIVAGQLLAIGDSAGGPRVFLCDAAGAGGDARKNAYGLAHTMAAIGEAVTVLLAGERTVPDAYWIGGVPLASDVGKIVYSTETPGSFSLTPPITPSSVTQKVGILSMGGAGTCRVTVQIGNAG